MGYDVNNATTNLECISAFSAISLSETLDTNVKIVENNNVLNPL